jgi:hypothetical protein
VPAISNIMRKPRLGLGKCGFGIRDALHEVR